MKVLIYRMGGLGDCVLIFPLLEILSKKGYDVVVWGRTDYFKLALQAGFCSRMSFFEPKDEFNLEIHFTNEISNLNRDNVIILKPWITEKMWFVDYYLTQLGLHGYEFTVNLSSFFSQNPKRDRHSLCIIHPGSGSKKKNASLRLFLMIEDFMKKKGFDVEYILGPCEMELSNYVSKFRCFCDILELTKYLLNAQVFVGLDSGVSHLSAYLGVKSYLFYGPSDPLIWHPIGKDYEVIRLNNCEPCFPNVCSERICLDLDALFCEFIKTFSK